MYMKHITLVLCEEVLYNLLHYITQNRKTNKLVASVTQSQCIDMF
jgi:hypothetical protein